MNSIEDHNGAHLTHEKPVRVLWAALVLTLIALVPSAASIILAARLTLSDLAPLIVSVLVGLGGFLILLTGVAAVRPVPRALLFAFPVAALLVLLVPPAFKGTIEYNPSQVPHHLMCVALTFGLAAAPTIATVVWLRRFVVASPTTVGFLSGVANAVVAASFAEVLCACGECAHVLLLHGGGIVLVSVAAAFALRWLAPTGCDSR